MNTVIGIYDDHELAVDAVRQLKGSGFPLGLVTIMGKAREEVIDEQMHIMEKSPINVVGVGTGTAIGAALGILTGVGIFAIPGLGFLYGAGALVGAIAGIDFGLISGGIISALTLPGMKTEAAKKYETELEEGKTLVIVHGDAEHVHRASDI